MGTPENLHEELSLLRDRVERLEAQEDKLWTLIWGNGKSGLRDDVTEIKRWMASMRKWMNLIAATLIVQLITAALGFLWLVFTHVASGKGLP